MPYKDAAPGAIASEPLHFDATTQWHCHGFLLG
jgi:hypothetical protein